MEAVSQNPPLVVVAEDIVVLARRRSSRQLLRGFLFKVWHWQLVATHLILMLASLLISTWLFIRIAEKGVADICDKSRGV